MTLPVSPPIAPMLGRLVRELPEGAYMYEPKWDGFRCLAFRNGGEVDLRSRNDRPLARYFPELVQAVLTLPEPRFVLDGEVVLAGEEGFDFPALMARLHPAASRVRLLSEQTPASIIGFDLVAVGAEDMRDVEFAERRRRLEQLLAGALPPVYLTPATSDAQVAREWLGRFHGGGIDGVMAKRLDQRYEPGARALLKVKQERTLDCIVGGIRLFADRPLVSSLLLGLYDGAGQLEHVGVASQFTQQRRTELSRELRGHVVPLEGHPWEHGFLTGGSPVGRLKGAAGRWVPEMERDWVPLAPVLVCEVSYDHVDYDRFRHPARFRRWRPDRDPRSCLLDQLEPPAPAASLPLTLG